MYQYVWPHKIMTALTWLKENNTLYTDVEINRQWETWEMLGKGGRGYVENNTY